MSISNLDKAKTNLKSAKIILNTISQDDSCIYTVAYLLQQALEMAIKYLLNYNGIKYPYTHNIGQLIKLAETNKCDLKLPDYLVEHSTLLTEWEAETRYNSNYLVDYKEVKIIIPLVDKYINSLPEHSTEVNSYIDVIQNIIDSNNLNITTEECLKLLPKQPVEDLEDLERLIILCAKSNYVM